MSTYGFLPIAGITLFIYLFSYFLTKTNAFKFLTHRRIWNLLLLVSFLVAGTIGIFMTIVISFEFDYEVPYKVLQTHAAFGTVWFIIATFHFFWHLTYFKKAIKVLFTKSRK